MVRRAPGASDARVYDVSSRSANKLDANLNVGAKSAAAERRSRRKAELADTNTQVVQDFEFPTVCSKIKLCADGRHIFASGTYPPQLHVYDTEQLSLKFKRHVDNDIVDFQVLETDWRKFALLTADRYVDLHSPFGSHFRTRVPTFGRDLMLLRASCDLLVCGDGPHAWRLNLEEGRFLAPVPTRSGADSGNNVCGFSPANGLLAFGGATGLLDVWDPRVLGLAQEPAGSVDIASSLPRGARAGITALRFDDRDGVTLGVGTESGQTLVYDLRAPRASLSRDQGNGLGIKAIRLHDDRRHVVSADARSIKLWERGSGRNVATVEPEQCVNHVAVVGSSGVLMAGLEAPRVKTYYVPLLGAAPKWCAFLDTFTEELEHGRSTTHALPTGGGDDDEDDDEQDMAVYEDYKFVSEEELERLGMRTLIGTDVLKPYMHGFFVHERLYKKAVEASEPFAFEKYRKQKAKERLEAERESRISKVKRNKRAKAKVNQSVVDALKEKTRRAVEKKNSRGKEKDKAGAKKAETGLSILGDERFSAMFQNEDFRVEESAERFQFLNPQGLDAARRSGRHEEEDESDEEELERLDLADEGVARVWSSGDEDSDEDGDDGSSSDDEVGGGADSDGAEDGIRKQGSGRKRMPRMYETDGGVRSGRGDEAGRVRERAREEAQVSLGERVRGRREATDGKASGASGGGGAVSRESRESGKSRGRGRGRGRGGGRGRRQA